MTRALLTSFLGGALAAMVLAVPARAEAPKLPAPAARSYVLLVGISNYADKQIKPRKHAEADAKALYDLFTNKDYLGADPKRVKLLLGSPDATRNSEPATRANLLEALRWLADEARPQDLVLFAFIGEGGPLGDSGDRRCYFASDSTFKGRDKDAVAASEIGEALKGLKSQRFCTFLDVDFRGFTDTAASRAVAEPTLGKAPYKEFLGDDGTEDHAPKTGRVLFLATAGLSPSLDLEDHGLFTQVLLDGLKGGADQEGYEPDGVVTVDELSNYLEKELPALARKHGSTEKEKQQLHWVLGGRGARFVLTTNPAAAPKVQKRLAALEKALKDGTIPARYADEARELLERMPRLKKRQELRKAYQELVDGSRTLGRFQKKRDGILASMELRRSEAFDFAERVIGATQIIKKDYLKAINQGEMVGWAIRGLYRYAEEKIPPKIEARLKGVKEMREASLAMLLADARQALGKREDLDNLKDMNVSLQRMLHKLDPYTTFIDKEALKRFKGDVEGHFTGIGIQIRKDAASDELLVVTPIKDSPAYKAKLMAGDIITTVRAKKIDEKKQRELDEVVVTPTKGLPLSKAVKAILGPPRTKVTLTIRREGVEKPFDVTITRGQVDVESVLGARRKDDDEWDYMLDPKAKIGYIRLTSFATSSSRDLTRVMHDLVRRGIKGFVLDLRFNPGGLLESAVEITDLYIDDGLIVSIRNRAGREKRWRGEHAGSLLDFPMVCLVNGGSASGSEIVSAALQDHKRALIIGERSYGKGSVQNILDYPAEGEGEIKLTTASFWRPSGKNLNKSSTGGKDEDEWGVIPDKVVKLTPKEREDLGEHQHNLEIIERPDKRKANKPEFKDRQLEAALEYLRGQIKMAGRLPSKRAG
jgi:C-terminal peptidase prc